MFDSAIMAVAPEVNPVTFCPTNSSPSAEDMAVVLITEFLSQFPSEARIINFLG